MAAPGKSTTDILAPFITIPQSPTSTSTPVEPTDSGNASDGSPVGNDPNVFVSTTVSITAGPTATPTSSAAVTMIPSSAAQMGHTGVSSTQAIVIGVGSAAVGVLLACVALLIFAGVWRSRKRRQTTTRLSEPVSEFTYVEPEVSLAKAGFDFTESEVPFQKSPGFPKFDATPMSPASRMTDRTAVATPTFALDDVIPASLDELDIRKSWHDLENESDDLCRDHVPPRRRGGFFQFGFAGTEHAQSSWIQQDEPWRHRSNRPAAKGQNTR